MLLAGPPIAAEPLASSLAASLNAVLVSPKAAVELAAAADDELGSALQSMIAEGFAIDAEKQEKAITALLSSSSAAAKGCVIYGVPTGLVTPTDTLALWISPDELSAKVTAAEEAAAKAAAPPPSAAEGEEERRPLSPTSRLPKVRRCPGAYTSRTAALAPAVDDPDGRFSCRDRSTGCKDPSGRSTIAVAP